MGKEPISAKQQEILQVIKDAILQKGYPPAVREICAAVDLRSTSTVHAHLEKLEQAGYIRRDPAKNRSIEIVDDDFGLTRREMANIPIVGRVAAGAPLLAEQNIEGYYPMPVEMLPNADVFILKVHGDSMAEMGILDGDSVLCAQTSTAANGDVVVENDADHPMSDKIIYNAEVTLETTAFDQALEKIGAMVSEMGGYVESSSVSGSNFSVKSPAISGP